MSISDEARQTYSELVVLKLLDLGPAQGGIELGRELPNELNPLESILQELRFKELVTLVAKPRGALGALRGKAKEETYRLTPAGIEYLGRLIDEAEGYVTEFEELEVEEMVAIAEARRLDPFRVRFLWGWFEGEFDDLSLFQERRGIEPVERLWAYYLTDQAFWDAVASDLTPAQS